MFYLAPIIQANVKRHSFKRAVIGRIMVLGRAEQKIGGDRTRDDDGWPTEPHRREETIARTARRQAVGVYRDSRY